jgi:fatty acid amide hydrolase 2
MPSLLQASAVSLAARMRRGELSPVDVVEAHIQRIQQVDPRLNALVAERFDLARREASAAARRIRRASAEERLPPLLGVPCTVKEFIAVQGMPWTAGIQARRGRLAGGDATVVQRLRKAGAIVLGSTNMAEGGLWMEARNPLYGHTNNPWDLDRTAGGSSGGCGALVACGAVPFSLGADIGGSVRIPAAFCGTFGHKPSGRMVPTTGHLPQPHGLARALLCLGPLTRRSEDLLPLLRILAGPDGFDPVVRGMALPSGEAWIDLAQLEVYPVEEHLGVAVWPEARRAVRRAARALEALGARVHPPDALSLGHGVLPWPARSCCGCWVAAATAAFRWWSACSRPCSEASPATTSRPWCACCSAVRPSRPAWGPGASSCIPPGAGRPPTTGPPSWVPWTGSAPPCSTPSSCPAPWPPWASGVTACPPRCRSSAPGVRTPAPSPSPGCSSASWEAG